MNTEEIGKRIESPDLCQLSDVADLSALVDKYPYAQSFQLLMLNTLGKNSDLRYDDALTKHAISITDRMHLYFLTQNKSETIEQTIAPIVAEILETESHFVPEEVSHEVIEEKTIPEVSETPVIEEEEIEEESVDLELGIEFEVRIEEIVKEEINEEIFENEISSSSFEEEKISVELGTIEKSNDPIADQFTSHALSQEYGLDSESLSLSEEAFGSEEFGESEREEAVGKSFGGWLKTNVTQVEEFEEHPVNRNQDILDKFISDDPRMTRPVKGHENEIKPKVPFFNPIEKAKESLDASKLPASETLAKIFEAQGNFPKAIHTYQSLMLLFPEKKIFFADRIQQLEKKLNK